MRRSESLAAFGAAPLEDEAAVFGRHARAKTMGLRPSSVVRLKGPLRHSNESPIKTKTLRLIFVTSYVKKPQGSENPVGHLGLNPVFQITGAALSRLAPSLGFLLTSSIFRQSRARRTGMLLPVSNRRVFSVREPYLHLLCLVC